MSKPTDGGFFLVARRVFDHRAFHEPYNDISAWLNLIARAEWEPRIVNRLGRTIRLQRGQLADSHRFLAERWGWEHKRVERFFDRLVKHRMIRKHIEAGIGIITIVNYRLYQDGSGQHPQDVASKSNRSALLPGQCRGKNRGSERGSEYPKNGAVNFAKSANAAGISKIGEDESGAVNRAVTGAVNGAVLFKNRGKENQLSKESKTRSKNPSRLPPGEVTLRATVREIRIAFEDWWEAYPRKVARKRATEVYTAAIKAGEATIAELLTGVRPTPPSVPAKRHGSLPIRRPGFAMVGGPTRRHRQRQSRKATPTTIGASVSPNSRAPASG